MRLSTFCFGLSLATAVVCAPTDSSCTSLYRRESLQKLVNAIISDSDADFEGLPLTPNITSILQTQGARVVLGTNIQGARNAIHLAHTVATKFGPAPEDLSQYFDNGSNEAFINGTVDLGLVLGGVRLPVVTAPAAQNMVFDTETCLAYLAVGSIEPVDGVVQEALDAFLLQNFPAYNLLDNIALPSL